MTLTTRVPNFTSRHKFPCDEAGMRRRRCSVFRKL